jgi:ParB-like chromosome segregation protein Spo0J
VKLSYRSPYELLVLPELSRSSTRRQFEERLTASIDEIGLAEPLKVARSPDGRYVVVDGVLRLHSILQLRERDQSRFARIPTYLVDYRKRFEIRFQTDIYQDLLPSQLASLVEHLHEEEGVSKADIARYIGVSSPTLRNYTGLWRMLQRGGLFSRLVELMDHSVLPSSNPFAWLRLTQSGVRKAVEMHFAEGDSAETWIEAQAALARAGGAQRFSLKFVESATGDLPASAYRKEQETRQLKQALGKRKSGGEPTDRHASRLTKRIRHLDDVASRSPDPVLRSAALSLKHFLVS